MLKTYSYNNYILCNKSLEFNTGYNLIKSIFNNIPEFNKLDAFKDQPLIANDIQWTTFPIAYHKGVMYFYYQKGYISYQIDKPDTDLEEDPNCIFFVGKGRCTPKEIEKLRVPPVDASFLK